MEVRNELIREALTRRFKPLGDPIQRLLREKRDEWMEILESLKTELKN